MRQEKIKARSKVRQAIRNRCSEDTLLILKKDWLRLEITQQIKACATPKEKAKSPVELSGRIF